MLTLADVLGYQGLTFGDFLLFFIYLFIYLFIFFFSIRPTDQISGNAFDAKRKKWGWPNHTRILNSSLPKTGRP